MGALRRLGRSARAAASRRSAARLSGEVDAGHVRVETDLDALGEATAVVEAVAEDDDDQGAACSPSLGARRRRRRDPGDHDLVAVGRAPRAAPRGTPERFVGLHVFNPVPKMKLVELAFPAAATDATRERARALCEALGKTAVEVPDMPGFVVNRLLFPYLFSAVGSSRRRAWRPRTSTRA